MCNRLLAAAHVMACCEATGNTAFIFALRKYRHYFQGLPACGIYYYRPQKRGMIAQKKGMVQILRSGAYPIDFPLSYTHPDIAKKLQAWVTIIMGWRFHDECALADYRATIRQFFTPREAYQKKINTCLNAIRQQCDCVVGVHIRRNDYATYREGLYYFNDACYSRWMAQIERLFPSQKVGFLLSSDDALDRNAFSQFCVHVTSGHELEDLYELAGCDYLVGPPSTYSMWASFYGNVPLCHVKTAQQDICFSEKEHGDTQRFG